MDIPSTLDPVMESKMYCTENLGQNAIGQSPSRLCGGLL